MVKRTGQETPASTRPDPSEPEARRPAFRPGELAYLFVTALLCGALVMVIEVLGSRVIGPVFGASLFVWTSLIAVTLVALSLGYAIGGVVVDRRADPDVLFLCIFAAGVFSILVPWMRAPVLRMAVPLGIRAGSLFSAALLFGPTLLLLGCVSPFLIRLASRQIGSVGRVAGSLAAVSTVGSFLGTVVTGFWLIGRFPASRIFQIAGGVLLLLAVAHFTLFRRRYGAALLLALPFLASPPQSPVSKVLPNGTRVTRVHEHDGFYGRIVVLDYTLGEAHTRELLIDGLIQGGIDVRSAMSVYEYAYALEELPWAVRPGGKSALVVGLGAGVVPSWFEKRGVRTDVVDIDPEIVDVARRFFGFRVSGDVTIADARTFLAGTTKSYDYIVLDVFTGDTTPGHVLSREALALLRQRLAPGGVLAMNLAGAVRGDTFITASIVRTLESVFRTVDVHPVFDIARSEGAGNLAILAYDGPLVPITADMLGQFPIHPLAEGIRPLLPNTLRFPRDTPAMILTDDWNPIEVRDRRLKELVRSHIFQETDLDMLL